MRIILLSRDQT